MVWLDPQLNEFHLDWDNHGSAWELFAQLLNWLACTLQCPYIVIQGNGEYEFNKITHLFEDEHQNWSNFPTNPTVGYLYFNMQYQ